MASIPEVYPKLREALEQFLHDQAEWESKFAKLFADLRRSGRSYTAAMKSRSEMERLERSTKKSSFVEKFRKVTWMNLAEEDIVSMEDLAVACSGLFWNDRSWDTSSPYVYENPELKQVAEDLLCLLKPVGEQLLPPEGPTDVQIWETFAAAKVQQKQFCIAVAYPLTIAGIETGLQRNNFLVLAMERKFRGLVNAFEKVHLSIRADISAELDNSLTNFTARLNSCCEGMIRRMTWAPSGKVPEEEEELGEEMRAMTVRWSRLSAQASQIAHQVAHGMGLEGLEAEHLEVGSVASVGSQSSCLSGHGGPHCFLPSHLFKVLRSGSAAPSLVWAQD